MIIKRVPDPRHSASVSTRISKLTDYIVRPDLKRPREKCLYAASRGFISETLAAQQLEMVALATVNPKARHPVTHYLLSWQDGEVPSAADIERAVDIFQAQLGIEGCQLIYGMHIDTDNLHLHICLNRVHPETERPIRINGGYDIEACHQAIARIEAEQGWAPEVHSRYIARGGNVFRTGFESDAPDITQKARDGERRTGNASVQQQVHHALVEVLGYASTWAEFHAGLARFGIAYVKKGNGAVCVLDRIEVKPSSALRKGSIKALEKLFGPFQIYEPDEIDDEIMPIRWPEPARHCSIKGGAGGALGLTVDGFECRVHEGAAYYSRRLGGAIEFIDRGSEIEVTAFRDEEAVLAALRLAAQKWPGDPLVIEGEPDFRRLVVRLAAREGLTLADPELQRKVEAERQVHARAVDIADARRSELAHVDKAIRHLGAERFEILQPAADRRRGNRASSLVARSPDARGFPTDKLASVIAEAEAQGIESADLALVPLARDTVYLALDCAADIEPNVGDRPIAFRLAHHGLPTRQQGVAALQPPDPDDALISGLIADQFEPHGDRISVRRDMPGALSLTVLEQGVALHPHPGAAVSACPTLTELLQEQQKARADTAALLDDIGLPSRQLLRETPEPLAAEAVPPPEVIAAARLLRAHMDAQPVAARRVHPSRIDADLAMQLRVIGYPREEVVAVIAAEFAAAGRDDAWITPDLYADRIADSAFSLAAAERYARAAVHKDYWIQITKNADPATLVRSEVASAVPGEVAAAGSLPLGGALAVILANGKLGSRDASPNPEAAGTALPQLPPRNKLEEILATMRANKDPLPPYAANGGASAGDGPSGSVKPVAVATKEPQSRAADGRDLTQEQVPAHTRQEGPSDGNLMPSLPPVEAQPEIVDPQGATDRAGTAANPGSNKQATLQPDILGASGTSFDQSDQPGENAKSAPQRDPGVVEQSIADSPSQGSPQNPGIASASSTSSVTSSSYPPPSTVEPAPAAPSSNAVSAIEEAIGPPASGRSGAAGNRPNPERDGHTQPESPFLRLLAKDQNAPVAELRDAEASTKATSARTEIEAPAIEQAPVPQSATLVNASTDLVNKSDAQQGAGVAPHVPEKPTRDPVTEIPADNAALGESETASASGVETENAEDAKSHVAAPTVPTPSVGADAPSTKAQDERKSEPSPAPVTSRANGASASGKSVPENNAAPGTRPLPVGSAGADRSPRTDSFLTRGSREALPEPDKKVEASSVSVRAEQDPRAEEHPEAMRPDLPIVAKPAMNNPRKAKRDDREHVLEAARKAGEGKIPIQLVQQPASPRPTTTSPATGATPPIRTAPGTNIPPPKTDRADQAAHDRPQQANDYTIAAQIWPSGERQPRQASNPSPPVAPTVERIPSAPPSGEDRKRKIEADSKAGEQTRSAARNEQLGSPKSPARSENPAAQDIAKNQADPSGEPSQKGDRSEAQNTQTRPPKAIQLPPPVPILEVRGGNASLGIAHEAMRVLVERFPQAVRRAEIPGQGKIASIERVLDPALLVGTQKKPSRADVALYGQAQDDFQKWSVEAVMALKPQERDWLTIPQHDHVRRVSHKLLLAQATMTDETLSMSNRQRAGWLMARSLPAIRHQMPPLVQSWLDRDRQQLSAPELGALAFLTQSTSAASAEECERFLGRIPTQLLTEKEDRIAKLAAEPPRPLENDEPALLFAHNVLAGATQPKLAEFIRNQVQAITLHAKLLKRLGDLSPDPIARQIMDVFRPPKSARTNQIVENALARIGMAAYTIASIVKIISQNQDRSR